MKHCLVAIDVDCIPISKGYRGQLPLDKWYEMKENYWVPGSQADKDNKVPVDGLEWGHTGGAGSGAGSTHHSSVGDIKMEPTGRYILPVVVGEVVTHTFRGPIFMSGIQ